MKGVQKCARGEGQEIGISRLDGVHLTNRGAFIIGIVTLTNGAVLENTA